MNSFFRKYGRILTGIGAIVTIAAGLIAFVGNSFQKTTVTVSDNSGNIIGAGSGNTIETGAITINDEYDAEKEAVRTVVKAVNYALKGCEQIRQEFDRYATQSLYQQISPAAYSMSTIFDYPETNSILSSEIEAKIEGMVERDIIPNSTLMQQVVNSVLSEQRELEMNMNVVRNQLESQPEYKNDTEKLEMMLEESEENYKNQYISIRGDKFTTYLNVSKGAYPENQYYSVFENENISLDERLELGRDLLKQSTFEFCDVVDSVANDIQ